jgi:hypothetical protein|eukprot:COSAG01_NODE_2997_length_6741_cov_8.936917_2_plen_116_part_00
MIGQPQQFFLTSNTLTRKETPTSHSGRLKQMLLRLSEDGTYYYYNNTINSRGRCVLVLAWRQGCRAPVDVVSIFRTRTPSLCLLYFQLGRPCLLKRRTCAHTVTSPTCSTLGLAF